MNTTAAPATRPAAAADLGTIQIVTWFAGDKCPTGAGWKTGEALIVGIERNGKAEVRFGRKVKTNRAAIVAAS